MLPMQFYKTNNLFWPLSISAKQFAITFRWNCSCLTTMEVDQIQSCLPTKVCYSCMIILKNISAGLLEFKYPSETSVWTLALPWLIKLLADRSTWIKEIILIMEKKSDKNWLHNLLHMHIELTIKFAVIIIDFDWIQIILVWMQIKSHLQ